MPKELPSERAIFAPQLMRGSYQNEAKIGRGQLRPLAKEDTLAVLWPFGLAEPLDIFFTKISTTTQIFTFD